MLVVDDDLVVAGEPVDDSVPGGTAAAGDENGLHAVRVDTRGKGCRVGLSRRRDGAERRLCPRSAITPSRSGKL